MRNQPPEIDRFGRFRDSGSGLYVPETYHRAPGAAIVTTLDRAFNTQKGFSQGLELARDENTLAVKFPRKGSGFDDLISQAIVDGMVANAGASPVIAPQISAMVRRQQNQAMTATVDVTGKPTPTNKARDAIAMFNDSPLGVNDALELMIYRLCTYNRGSPISTVPVMFDFETWEELGMIAHPILANRQKEENATKFWLEVDWSKFGQPVPFLPHPFDLEATGNAEWPYWYRASRANGQRIWVLLSSDQIVPVVPGKSSKPGIGNSAVWMCLGYLAEQILINDERIEKMLYSLTDGIILIGGVSDVDPNDIMNKVEQGRQANYERGYAVAKGTTIIASPVDQVSTAQISLRQPPGIEFKDWREWAEDVIAFCFSEPLTAMVTRGRVGFGASAKTSSDNASETGVGAHLARIGGALGSVYPRVMITVTRQNDKAAQQNIDTLNKFSTSASLLIGSGVITAKQANRIIDRDILPLPEDEDVTTSANADDSQENVDNEGDDTNEAAADNKANPPPTAQPAPAKAVAASAKENSLDVLGALLNDKPDSFNSAALRPDVSDDVLQQLEVLYSDGDVTITDADADQAYELARTRVGRDVFELLIAEPVEE